MKEIYWHIRTQNKSLLEQSLYECLEQLPFGHPLQKYSRNRDKYSKFVQDFFNVSFQTVFLSRSGCGFGNGKETLPTSEYIRIRIPFHKHIAAGQFSNTSFKNHITIGVVGTISKTAYNFNTNRASHVFNPIRFQLVTTNPEAEFDSEFLFDNVGMVATDVQGNIQRVNNQTTTTRKPNIENNPFYNQEKNNSFNDKNSYINSKGEHVYVATETNKPLLTHDVISSLNTNNKYKLRITGNYGVVNAITSKLDQKQQSISDTTGLINYFDHFIDPELGQLRLLVACTDINQLKETLSKLLFNYRLSLYPSKQPQLLLDNPSAKDTKTISNTANMNGLDLDAFSFELGDYIGMELLDNPEIQNSSFYKQREYQRLQDLIISQQQVSVNLDATTLKEVNKKLDFINQYFGTEINTTADSKTLLPNMFGSISTKESIDTQVLYNYQLKLNISDQEQPTISLLDNQSQSSAALELIKTITKNSNSKLQLVLLTFNLNNACQQKINQAIANIKQLVDLNSLRGETKNTNEAQVIKQLVHQEYQAIEHSIPSNGYIGLSKGQERTRSLISQHILSLADTYQYFPNLNFIDSFLNPKTNSNQHSGQANTTKIPTFANQDLTSEQRQVVEKLFNTKDIGVLYGATGTGKATIISELVAQLVASKQSALIVTKTEAYAKHITRLIARYPLVLCTYLANQPYQNFVQCATKKFDLSIQASNTYYYDHVDAYISEQVYNPLSNIFRPMKLYATRVQQLGQQYKLLNEVNQKIHSFQKTKQKLRQELEQEKQVYEINKQAYKAASRRHEELLALEKYFVSETNLTEAPQVSQIIPAITAFGNELFELLDRVQLSFRNTVDDFKKFPEAQMSMIHNILSTLFEFASRGFPVIITDIERLINADNEVLEPPDPQEISELTTEIDELMKRLDDTADHDQNHIALLTSQISSHKNKLKQLLRKSSRLNHPIYKSFTDYSKWLDIKCEENLERAYLLRYRITEIAEFLQTIEARFNAIVQAIHKELSTLDFKNMPPPPKTRMEIITHKNKKLDELYREQSIHLNELQQQSRSLLQSYRLRPDAALDKVLNYYRDRTKQLINIRDDFCKQNNVNINMLTKVYSVINNPLVTVNNWKHQMSDIVKHCNIFIVSSETDLNQVIQEAKLKEKFTQQFDMVIYAQACSYTIDQFIPAYNLGKRHIFVGDPFSEIAYHRYTQNLGIYNAITNNPTGYNQIMLELFNQSKNIAKATLSTQFRCHPDIYQLCNPFYQWSIRSTSQLLASSIRGNFNNLNATNTNSIPELGTSVNKYAPITTTDILPKTSKLDGQQEAEQSTQSNDEYAPVIKPRTRPRQRVGVSQLVTNSQTTIPSQLSTINNITNDGQSTAISTHQDPQDQKFHHFFNITGSSGKILTPHKHLLWIDFKDDKLARNAINTSSTRTVNNLNNQTIAKTIAQTLMELNRQVLSQHTKQEQQITNSSETNQHISHETNTVPATNNPTIKKVTIAVISLYQKQLQAIKKAIRALNHNSLEFDGLDIEISTVFDLAETEYDHVLVSHVEAKNSSLPHIYQLHNQMYSRARKLLMVFGDSEYLKQVEKQKPLQLKVPLNQDQIELQEYPNLYNNLFTKLEKNNFLVSSELFRDAINRQLKKQQNQK